MLTGNKVWKLETRNAQLETPERVHVR